MTIGVIATQLEISSMRVFSSEGRMKYLNFVLTVIAVALIGVSLKLYLLENSLKTFSESSQMLIGSNQALLNSNFRLETELVNLRKEVSAIKESFPKK